MMAILQRDKKTIGFGSYREVRRRRPWAASRAPEAPYGRGRFWRIVGLELAHVYTFCGAPSEATLGYPDENAPLILQIGVCNNCLVDCVMQRFREVKHGRMVQLAYDMTAAANAVAAARRTASSERYERGAQRMLRKLGRHPDPDPDEEAEAAQRLAAEEESIARKYDMHPDWSYDEFERDYQQAWRARRR